MEEKIAALYVRVSTDAQREEGYSIEAQKQMLLAYCVSKQIKNYEFYIDGGFSGSNLNRPKIKQLIQDAKDKKLSSVIVYKLDRLSRSQRDTLYLIEEILNPNEVDFVSMNESMDTSTPLGRLMLGILSAFAQLERENIKERTRMGMRERVKSGLWPGGGRVPFGYDYDETKGILVPNSDAETVRRIYDLYLQGYAMYKIAQIVGLKYEKLATQIITRKSNAGFICYGGMEYKGLHEPIVSLETYERAMRLMKERSVKHFTNSSYLLSGLVYCGKCGAKMRYQKWGKNGCKLSCYSQDKNKAHIAKDPDCDNEKIWADEVEEKVVKGIFEFAIERNETKSEMEYKVIDALHTKLKKAENKLKRLYLLFADGDDDKLLIEEINKQKKDITAILSDIETETEKNTIAKNNLKLTKEIKNIEDAWPAMTDAERQNIIRTLIKRVTVTKNLIKVEYQF